MKKEEERKKLVEKVVIENETQLRKRVEEQEGKLAIKDSRSFFFFDAKVNGKRVIDHGLIRQEGNKRGSPLFDPEEEGQDRRIYTKLRRRTKSMN